MIDRNIFVIETDGHLGVNVPLRKPKKKIKTWNPNFKCWKLTFNGCPALATSSSLITLLSALSLSLSPLPLLDFHRDLDLFYKKMLGTGGNYVRQFINKNGQKTGQSIKMNVFQKNIFST